MAQSNFNNVVESLLKGMGSVMSSHTVVGEATRLSDDTYIIPLVDVTFGVGAGAGGSDKRDTGSGGFGAKMSPSAILVVKDGHTKLVNIKNQDAVTKLLDFVPDIMDRFTGKTPDVTSDEAEEIAFGKKTDE